MTLFEFALAALLLAAGNAYDSKQHEAGAVKLAHSIEESTRDTHDTVWSGKDSRYLNVTLLAVTAWYESKFNEKVIDCRIKGDGGMSITAYQMMKPWALGHMRNGKLVIDFSESDMCSDPTLASRHAIHVMMMYDKSKAKKLLPHALFQTYGTGNPRSTVKRLTRRCQHWAHVSNKLGIRAGKSKISCYATPKDVTLLVEESEKNVSREIRKLH